MNKYYLIIVASTLIAGISQMLLKKSADIDYESKIKEYLNTYVIFGYFLLFASMLLMILANKGLDYKTVNAFESISYVIVLLLGRICFKEKITRSKLIGVLIIAAGIYVFCV